MRTAIFLAALSLAAYEGVESYPVSIPAILGPVMMGDSITAHWDESAYAVPILKLRLPDEINAGVSGNTTEQMLARFRTDVLDRHPAKVVIEGGINDLHFENLPQTLARIVEMGNDASAAGIRVFIALIPHADLTWANIPRSDIKSLNAMLRDACADYGWTCIDYYAATSLPDGSQNTALFEWDHTHPNARGYDAMWPVLKQAL
jgi:lysophospholipase L1-like esterase